MGISGKGMVRAGAFSVAFILGASVAHAGCTANLSSAQELNIRSGPSTNYQSVGKIPGGECGIRIRNCEDGWCRIRYDGVTGYSSEFYLRRTNEARDDGQQQLQRWLNIARDVFAQLASDPNWDRIGAVEVGRDRDRSVIQLDRSDGRFDALRMRVRGSDVEFRRIVVVYGNGRRQNLNYSEIVEAGGETGELELRGQRGRFIDRIIIVHQKARRRGPPAGIEVWAHRTGGASGRVGFGPGWKRLATTTANLLRDRDVIQFDRDDGRFEAFRMRVLDSDVRIRRFQVRFGNGNTRNIDVPRRIAEGRTTDPIELPGRRGRFIDRITIIYDTIGFGPRAKVELWGLQGSGGPDRVNFGPDWNRVATTTANRSRDRDVIQLGRGEGRIDSLRLRALGNDVRIRRLRVQYGNGNAHNLDVGRRLNEGDATDPIELRGRRGRFINRVIIIYDTVGRGPRAKVELWARKG